MIDYSEYIVKEPDPYFQAFDAAQTFTSHAEAWLSRPADAVKAFDGYRQVWTTFSKISPYCANALRLLNDAREWAIYQRDVRELLKERRAEIREKYDTLFDALAERDGELCRICGTTRNLCIDHVTPLIKGGTNAIDNLQLLCGDCNLRKSDK